MSEPRTHYQISLTARQAVGLFVGLLLSLGLAFFFGLMAGFAGRERPPRAAQVAAVAEKSSSVEGMPPVETAVPTAASSGPSRTELAAGRTPAMSASTEATIPSALRPFEDGTTEEALALTPMPKGKGPVSGGGAYWVQVASLASHEEANAISRRLSKHGFHTQVVTASGPKGRLFRIRTGPYRSEEEASRAASWLSRQEKIKQPWVVPEGK
ncbi:MAG TPA: SPOR domain-containing protein [Thermoanaerobaculia bacterium]